MTDCAMTNQRDVFRLVPSRNGRYLRSEAAEVQQMSIVPTARAEDKTYIAVHPRLFPAPLLRLSFNSNTL